MKIVFKLDTGTEISTAPDQLMLVNGDNNQIVLGYRLGGDTMVPLFNFPGTFFTAETLKAHDAAVLAGASNITLTPPKSEKEGQGAVEGAPTVHGGGNDPMGD